MRGSHKPNPARLCLRLSLLMLALASALLPPAHGLAQTTAAPAQSSTAAAGPVFAPNLAVISIEGDAGITAVTSKSFERRLSRAVEGGADAIVIDLDTPGGEVGAVLEICTLIKQTSVPTIAWVNPRAYSGGAIIAVACDQIILASVATMGDAAPVAFDPLQGIAKIEDPEIRQKQLVPLLSEIVDSARRNGYDEVLIQGMVSLGVETWQVRNDETGEIYFLTEPEYRQLFGEAPQRGTPLIASGGIGAPGVDLSPGAKLEEAPETAAGFQPASPMFDSDLTAAVGASIASVSDRPNFADENAEAYTLIGYATDGNTLLTMKGPELRAFGFVLSPQSIDTDEQLMQHVGAQNLARLDQSWSESLVAFMTQGFSGLIIRGLLIVVFLLAMFIEMSAPGVGVAGTIGLAALAGIIVPPLLIGAATWWTLAAIVVGFGLILVELLVLPGFGIPGLAGLATLMLGLVGSFAGTGEIFPGAGGSGSSNLAWAVATVLLATFASGAGMYFFTKYTRSIPIANRLVLAESQRATESTADAVSPSLIEAMGPASSGSPVAIGAVGVATTDLHPSGAGEFDGELVDVVAELGYVEKGDRIRVVSATEYRVGVERIGDDVDTGGAA